MICTILLRKMPIRLVFKILAIIAYNILGNMCRDAVARSIEANLFA